MSTSKLLFSGFLLIAFFICNSVAQNPWTEKADMPTARLGHSSCLLDGKIYAIGGTNTSQEPGFTTLEVYDPLLDTWTPKAGMDEVRANFATCVVDGKILAIGGGRSFWWAPRSSIEEYDPDSDTWTLKTDMPRARMGLTASLVNGKIYIIGGADTKEISFAEVDVYDPLTNTWTTAADLPTPRFQLKAVVVNEKIYTIGGHIGYPWKGLLNVEEYDPATDTWTTKANMITGRKYFTACALNSKIYVFGGVEDPFADTGYNLSSVEEYDPATDTWTEKTNMPLELAAASAVSFDGKICLSGGSLYTTDIKDNPFDVVNSMFTYDPLLEPTGIEGVIPQEISLVQIYPNPFNLTTTINYRLNQAGMVNLVIYDLLGQKVATLVSEVKRPGNYTVEWNALDITSGMYICRLELEGSKVLNRKMMLLR